jgi:hypothetical protein
LSPITDINTAFTYARESVSAEVAAIRYGLQINRAHRAKCPFHGGEHYNLSFKGVGFNCFVCGASGDSIEFTRLLFGYEKPIEALKRLNEDFGLGINLVGADIIRSRTQPRSLRADNIRPYSAVIRDIIAEVHRVLWEYERGLSYVKRELKPLYSCEEPLDLWVYALHNADYAEALVDWFDETGEEEQLKYIEKERNKLNEYERINRVIDGIRRYKKYGAE